MLKIAVPNKGRLSERTVDLFERAGVKLDGTTDRRLLAHAPDQGVTLLFVRAQDIPEYVQDGVVHLGVTGLDIVEETSKDVERLMDLRFGNCRLVVACPEDSPIKSAADVPDGARIATSFPHIAQRHFDKRGKRVKIIEVSGATEATPHLGVADFIVDLTSTGSTLAMNALREVETVLASSAWVIGNRAAAHDTKYAPRIRELLAALESVIHAKGKRYLMANVERAKLDKVREILPGLTGPTIMELAGRPDWVAAHAVVDENQLYRVVHELKRVGATGILVLPIERLVP